MRYVGLLLVIVCGCTFQPDNHRPVDMSVPKAHDMARAAAPDLQQPAGAIDMTAVIVVSPDLSIAYDLTPNLHFNPAVQSILNNRGCATPTCHQAYAPLLMQWPQSDAQWQQNYSNVMADVTTKCDILTPADCAASSLLLTKPLTNSGVTHAGGVKPFASTADVDYQSLLLWIEEGARL